MRACAAPARVRRLDRQLRFSFGRLDFAAHAARAHWSRNPSGEHRGEFSRVAAGYDDIDIPRVAELRDARLELLGRRILETKRLQRDALTGFRVGQQLANRTRGDLLDALAHLGLGPFVARDRVGMLGTYDEQDLAGAVLLRMPARL